MIRFRSMFVLVCGLILGSLGTPPATGQAPPSGWKLVWNDEFAGTKIDPARWDFDLGSGYYNAEARVWINGWGNDELQTYTNRPENAFVADGMLHIRAIKETLNGSAYTSARLKTRKADKSPLFAQAYGRYEFRARLPAGRGLWPALWLLPLNETYGGWAASGEIDIMEARGQDLNQVLGTLHYGSSWPGNTYKSHTYQLPDQGRTTDFHVYALEWEPGEIRWYVDDRLTQTQNSWWSSRKKDAKGGVKPSAESDLFPWPAPFDQPFSLVMNLAVGGKFLGNPDASTPFPGEMVVDYVRVYEEKGGYGASKPRGKEALPFTSP